MAGINFVDNTNRPFLDTRIKSAYQIFIKVAVPAAVAGVPPPLVLETNAEGWKTPTITTNPNAVYLACSKAGLDIATAVQSTDEFCDEKVDPESTLITSRKITVKGEYLGVLDEKLLLALYGMTAFHAPGDTFQHFGDAGAISPPVMSVLALWRRDGATPGTFKYGYFFFPNCEQIATYPGGKFTSKERVTLPVEFVAKGYDGYGGRAFTKYFEE